MSVECFLSRFTDTTCDGPYDRAHLIPQQRLRQVGLGSVVDDTRSWAPACRKHHHAFDVSRTIRLQLDDYPESLREFADQHGFYFGGPERGWVATAEARAVRNPDLPRRRNPRWAKRKLRSKPLRRAA